MKRQLAYPLRVFSHIVRLPKYITFFEGKDAVFSTQIARLESIITRLSEENKQLSESIETAKKKSSTIDKIDNKITDLQHQLRSQRTSSNTVTPTNDKVINATVSDNHDFDNFYKRFEDEFRGTEELIKERVSEHLPLFAELPRNLKKKNVIDIGCGRGEFLSVIKEAGYHGIGVDMNEEMVDRANNLGLNAVLNDAEAFLKTQDSSSLAAITGFHIVEHIPFEILMAIFAECYRTIDRGGFVLFETPNPRSLFVGANTFYIDPSHQRPVPSELLSFMLEYVGFDTKTVLLHRSRAVINSNNKPISEVYETVFGHADYAVIGRKI